MRHALRSILLILCLLTAAEQLCAQFYSWGADPTSFRWKQMRTKEYRVVYPDTARNIASRMMLYLDAVKEDIDYGYRHPQMSIPFVVHPANALSNGLVMWLPKRVEFLSTPDPDGYSMPWTKQLVAHEYRHAVQYNNLNRGLIKALSYILGQQSSTVGLLLMPLWMMEGDAVMTETAMSTYGRGLQPSFTMAYRAYGNVASRYRNIDKWFCGSYKQHIPNHYNLGYLLSRYGYNRYGRVMGNDVAWLTARRPYMIISSSLVLKRLYGVTTKQLFLDAFDELESHWAPLDDITESSTPLPIPEPRSYTTYRHPMPTAEGRLIALKEDLDRPMALVEIDTLEGRERHIAYTGMVSTRPALGDNGRLWWTEYRRSALFDEKSTSKLFYMDLDEERPRAMRNRFNKGNILYPTPTTGNGIAWVEYTYDGRYTVIINGPATIDRRTPLPLGSEIHGMAWDNTTEALYLLITDDDGMHIARVVKGGTEAVTRPAYITLSDLRARDGRLYYGSIASGKDEAHCYDLLTAKELRLTTSRYGAFDPMPIDSGRVVATRYDERGYLPVVQSSEGATAVEYSPKPPLVVLPTVKDWDVVNLDTVRYTPAQGDTIRRTTPPRRFSRALHAFNIHSWAPASYDPYEIMEESRIAFNVGATLMSQNILSTMEGFATWGWNRDEGSVYKLKLRYYGLGVNLWLGATYGGSQNIHTVYAYDPDTDELIFPHAPKRDKYYSVNAGASLPLLFMRGYHTRQLNIAAAWDFSNGMVANVDRFIFEGGKITNFSTIGYSEGVHLLQTSITFQDVVRQAHRDFLPPWGVILSASHAMNPTTNDFGQLVVGYAKLYTPGFARHHSLSIAASYQTSLGGFQSPTVFSGLAFKSTRLLPRGFSSYHIENDHYVATSLNYQLPLWYPDGGWRGVIYFKRLRLNLGGDYASFRKLHGFDTEGLVVKRRRHIWSYGGDLSVDFNLFGMPDSATLSATLSVYVKGSSPTDHATTRKPYISFGLGMPF